METYTTLRAFADSWALLFLTLFFIGVVLFVFRRSARERQHDAATSIFRHEDRPAAVTPAPATPTLPTKKDRT